MPTANIKPKNGAAVERLFPRTDAGVVCGGMQGPAADRMMSRAPLDRSQKEDRHMTKRDLRTIANTR
jgi:hypothetical protein